MLWKKRVKLVVANEISEEVDTVLNEHKKIKYGCSCNVTRNIIILMWMSSIRLMT